MPFTHQLKHLAFDMSDGIEQCRHTIIRAVRADRASREASHATFALPGIEGRRLAGHNGMYRTYSEAGLAS